MKQGISSLCPEGTLTEVHLEPVLSILHKGKVKCTLVQALRLCTGRTVHRVSRGIALPFLE
jgi:hypothetical protein